MPLGLCACDQFNELGIGAAPNANDMLGIASSRNSAIGIDFGNGQNFMRLKRGGTDLAYLAYHSGQRMTFLALGAAGTTAGFSFLGTSGVDVSGPITASGGITGAGVTSTGASGMLSIGTIQSGVAVGASASDGRLRLATTNVGNTLVRTWQLSVTQADNQNLVLRNIEAGTAPLTVQASTGTIDIAGSLVAANVEARTSMVVGQSGLTIGLPPPASQSLGLLSYGPIRATGLMTADAGISIGGGTISLTAAGVMTATGYVAATQGFIAGSPTAPHGVSVYGSVKAAGTTKLALGTGVTDHLWIDTSGNVGIGLPSPTQRLDVSGNIRALGVFVANTTVNSSGDVNVGHNLSVANNATVTQDLFVQSAIHAGTGNPPRKIADGNGCYYA